MKSLLERIADLAPLEGAGGPGNTAESILEHLKQLLNTRRGDVLIQPEEYGLEPISELRNRIGLRGIEAAIQRLIERFEPRLASIVVESIGTSEDGHILRFAITATAMEGTRSMRVRYETKVDPLGKIEVAK